MSIIRGITVSGPNSVWIDSELGENEKNFEMSVMEMDDLASAKSVTEIILPEPCVSHMIPPQNDRKLQNSGNNCVETGKNISLAKIFISILLLKHWSINQFSVCFFRLQNIIYHLNIHFGDFLFWRTES